MDKLEIYNQLLKVKLDVKETKTNIEQPAKVFKTGRTDSLSTRGGGVWYLGTQGGAKKIEPSTTIIFANYE